jgi:hypothetical protein
MTDPIAAPMSVDDEDLSEDVPEDGAVGDADDKLAAAEADWIEENEGSLGEGSA